MLNFRSKWHVNEPDAPREPPPKWVTPLAGREHRAHGPGGIRPGHLNDPLDRPSRFSAGLPGVLYAGNCPQVALAETVFHHGVFMAKTKESPGWTSQFREIVLAVEARLHDLRGAPRNPSNYQEDQALGTKLRAAGSNGVVYQSVRWPLGECVGLFYPDCAQNALQARHLDYHWDGSRVDLYRTLKADGTHQLFRIIDEN